MYGGLVLRWVASTIPDILQKTQSRIPFMHAGLVLRGGRQHHPDLAPSMVLERPKVLYNDLTRTFVMWMHIDDADYSMARAGKPRNPPSNTLHCTLRVG